MALCLLLFALVQQQGIPSVTIEDVDMRRKRSPLLKLGTAK